MAIPFVAAGVKLLASKAAPWIIAGLVGAAGVGAGWLLWSKLRAADKALGAEQEKTRQAVEDANLNAAALDQYRAMVADGIAANRRIEAEKAAKQAEVDELKRGLHAAPAAHFCTIPDARQRAIRDGVFRQPGAASRPAARDSGAAGAPVRGNPVRDVAR